MLLNHCGRTCVNKWLGRMVVFSYIPKNDRFLSKLISNCQQSLSFEEPCIILDHAVDNLEQIHVEVGASTYASLLCLCVQPSDLSYGKRIHDHLKKSRYKNSSHFESLVLQMYIKCGALEEAHALFEKMLKPNVYSWSHLIGAYARLNDGERSLQLFDRMQWEGIWPQKVTFSNLLSNYLNDSALNRGRQLHVLIIERGFHTCVKLGTALVTMYARCGCLAAARGVFDCLLVKDVVSWNAMIEAYDQQESFDDAFRIFLLMQQQEGVVPTISTFVSTLGACTGQAALIEGKKVHMYILSAGFDSNILVTTALINMYGKCNSLDDAQVMFARSKANDVILWNTMIAVLALQGHHSSMLQLFGHMQSEGCLGDQATFVSIFYSCANKAALPEGKRMHTHAAWLNVELSVEVGSAIVNMYDKCTDIKAAEKVFRRLDRRDILAWTSMITAYAQNERGKEALQLFNQMKKEKIVPDKVAFLSILPGYGSQAVLTEAQLMHEHLCCVGLDCNLEIGNALITMYGKCGSLKSAGKLFDMMRHKDLISWNALLAVYAQHGHGKEVLVLYNQLEAAGIKPDCITYVTVFLACSHSGLLEEGHKCLVSMTQDHGIVPKEEHLNCVIDLLARAGQLDEAETLLQSLQSEPTYAQWVTLLGACKNQVDLERGERAATQAFKLDSSDTSPYILLGNMYALARNVEIADTAIN
ncbi:hypothetical protein GOP47_0017068 [Adiantum capillus-veneris]|uniref:Pentatricopeptide repeat-containing protein n=1 Tax=Adiantum capillus-veneris TaxID=13818 RepID=A0A9D4ZAW8_ADICA|nr:hypothetical protein GOP47_0017068 [Adiantum capillus-veneris]